MNTLKRAAVAAGLALTISGCGFTITAGTVAETTPSTTVTTSTLPPDPPTLPTSPPAGLCRSYDEPVSTGVVANEAVTEASGMAASTRYPDIIWMHNDSGGGPIVFATTVAGDDMGAFELDAIEFDWEDMAIGPGPDPGLDYLYLGDIGDNLHFRGAIAVYRIAEPTPARDGGVIADVTRFDLAYPDPGHDAEALFVDPVTGDIIIVTKPESGNPALIFRAPGSALQEGTTTPLIPVGSFPLQSGVAVTAADIDRTGAVIVFRGYNEVWLWERRDIDFTETFAAEPCRTPSTAEVQGEAITFTADGYSYYTVSEGTNPDINFVLSIFD